VLEDETTQVVGYILGSTDTRAYERYLAEHWWPALAEKYPVEKAVKPADIYYTNLLRNMHTASDSNIAFSPAHLHIDILEAYQKQGWGRRLIAVAVQYLTTKGLQILETRALGNSTRSSNSMLSLVQQTKIKWGLDLPTLNKSSSGPES
jgi:GNAT superfamily N-acetyltransferase